jgi:hypothetical protein
MKTKKKATKIIKKLEKPNQARVRSKAARAHIAEGTRRTTNQSTVRKGIRAAGTEDDLGAARRSGC